MEDQDELDAQLAVQIEAEMEAEMQAEMAIALEDTNEMQSSQMSKLDNESQGPEVVVENNCTAAPEAEMISPSVQGRQKRPRPRRLAVDQHPSDSACKALPPVRTASNEERPSLPSWATELMSASDNDHVGYIWGMNIVTGRSIEEESSRLEPSDVGKHIAEGSSKGLEDMELVQLSYGSYQGVQLSASELRKIKAQECAQILREKKLVLVLDLDHTLLNSAALHELQNSNLQAALSRHLEGRDAPRSNKAPVLPSSGEACANSEGTVGVDSDAVSPSGGTASTSTGSRGEDGGTRAIIGNGFRQQVTKLQDELLHFLPDIHMWTKLRPYAHEFLKGASERFELYVYTMGTKAYAAKMVTLLDPSGELGLKDADRVIAREDSTAGHLKGLDVVLGSDRTILILDDSPSVWPNEGPRLIVPKRYLFFPSPLSRKGTSGHLIHGTDEPTENGQLHRLLMVLCNIHTHYFEHVLPNAPSFKTADDCPNVSESVAAVRRKVLEGQHILFSGVIPLQQQHNSPESHAAWRLASELGATLALDVGPAVTHVVAGCNNTTKVSWANDQNIPVVSLEWLHASGYMWERADEKLYPVGKDILSATGLDLDQMRPLPPPEMHANI